MAEAKSVNGLRCSARTTAKKILSNLTPAIFFQTNHNFFGSCSNFMKSWKIRTAKKCDLYLKKLIIAGLRSYKDVFIEWKPLALNWYKNSANIVSGVYTDYSCYSTTLGPIKAAWEGFLEDRLAIVVDRGFFSKWRNIQVIPVNALSFIGTTKKYVSHSVNRKTRTLKFMEFSTDWEKSQIVLIHDSHSRKYSR